MTRTKSAVAGDQGFLRAQEGFAAANPWCSARKLIAKSHFPMLEIPEDMAKLIESFVAQE
jgi:hypothetical protein